MKDTPVSETADVKAPMARTTIADLAAHLGLSKGTVSRILNNKGAGFSAATRQRVFDAAREIGYAPDPLARALATGKTGFVALWVQTLVTSYHAQIAHAMEEALEGKGYQIAVTPFGRIDRDRATYLGTPAGVDGIIAHEIYGDIWPLLFRNTSHKVPVVTTGIWSPNNRDHVQVNLTNAAHALVHHLCDTGRTRVAYATDEMEGRTGDVRYIAYHAVLQERGLTPERIALPAPDRASARATFRAYFREHGCPGALFCHNDDFALAAYRALCDLGLSIPGDCALAGCDGIMDTEYLPVPITTIVQPFEEISQTACAFMQNRLSNPDGQDQFAELSAVLAIRASSQV